MADLSVTCADTCPCLRHQTVDFKLAQPGFDRMILSTLERQLLAALIPANDVHLYRDVLLAVWPERVARMDDPRERVLLLGTLHTRLYLLRLHMAWYGWTIETTTGVGLRLIPCNRQPGARRAWHVPSTTETFLADSARRAQLLAAIAAGRTFLVACREARITRKSLLAARRHDAALNRDVFAAVDTARTTKTRGAQSPAPAPELPPQPIAGKSRPCPVAGCGVRLAAHPRCNACLFAVGPGHFLQFAAGSATCRACVEDARRKAQAAHSTSVAAYAH